MLLIIQLILYCLLFFLMVKAAVKDNGMNLPVVLPAGFYRRSRQARPG